MHRDGRYRLNSKWHRLRTSMSRERRVFFVCLSRSNWAQEEFPFNPIIGIVIPPEPSLHLFLNYPSSLAGWLAGSTYFDDESSALQSVDALDWINLMIIVSFFDCTNWVQWPGLRLIHSSTPSLRRFQFSLPSTLQSLAIYIFTCPHSNSVVHVAITNLCVAGNCHLTHVFDGGYPRNKRLLPIPSCVCVVRFELELIHYNATWWGRRIGKAADDGQDGFWDREEYSNKKE